MAFNFQSNDWRRPGCGNTCHIKYVFLPGLSGREPLQMHDPEAHEAWGAGHTEQVIPPPRIVETGPLRIDLHAREVAVNGVIVPIPGGAEWDLLSLLARHIERRFSTRELIVLLRGPEYSDEAGHHLLRVIVYRLRRHLREAAYLLDSRMYLGYCLLNLPTSEPSPLAPIRRWSSKYDACIVCETTERLHHSNGRCSRCRWRHVHQMAMRAS